MPSVQFGDLAKVAPKSKRRSAAPKEAEVVPPALLPQSPEPEMSPKDRVLVAFAVFGRLVEARRDLAGAITALEEINAEALDDPALADHPQLEVMRGLYDERSERVRQLWIKAIELGNNIGAMWEHLTPEQRERSGLATLLAVDKHAVRLTFDLWNQGTPIDRIAPLPEPWAIPSDLAHLIGITPNMEIIEASDLMNAAMSAPF